MLNVLYFDICTFQSACAVPSMSAFYSPLISCFSSFRYYYCYYYCCCFSCCCCVVVELITLFSISLLRNLHIYHTVIVIRLSQGTKIILSPKVKGRALGIWVLCDTYVIVLPFATHFKLYLVKPTFCRYCRKFMVTSSSAEMTEGCI